MSLTVRRARREDVPFLAEIMLAASRSHLPRGIWDLIIQEEGPADEPACVDYLRRMALAEPRSLYYFENFLIADADTEQAAALSVYAPDARTWELVAEAQSVVQRGLGWSEARSTASARRMAPVWACLPEGLGADWVVENVATVPAYQRRGAGKALLEAAIALGRERGFRLAQITTYMGNSPALQLYATVGFRRSGEKACPELEKLLGTSGFVQLLCDLETQ